LGVRTSSEEHLAEVVRQESSGPSLATRVRQLENALSDRDEELEALRRNHEEASQSFREQLRLVQAERDAALGDLDGMRATLAALQSSEETVAHRTAELTSVNLILTSQLQSANQQREALEGQLRTANDLRDLDLSENRKLIEELDRERELREDLEVRTAQLASPENEMEEHSHHRVGGSFRRHIDSIISTLFGDRLEFLRDSMDYLVDDLTEYRPVCTLLRRVYENPPAVGGQRVATTDGWLEQHFSTGQDDDGRLYYKQINSSRYQILLSRKARQRRDISYLQRW
jgi:chromosome segregation ATPase